MRSGSEDEAAWQDCYSKSISATRGMTTRPTADLSKTSPSQSNLDLARLDAAEDGRCADRRHQLLIRFCCKRDTWTRRLPPFYFFWPWKMRSNFRRRESQKWL